MGTWNYIRLDSPFNEPRREMRGGSLISRVCCTERIYKTFKNDDCKMKGKWAYKNRGFTIHTTFLFYKKHAYKKHTQHTLFL